MKIIVLGGFNSEAIDFRAASESFAPVRKLRRSDLLSLGITTKHQGKQVPTVGGILLFGSDRERLFPDAWIQVGRFAGETRSRIVDQRELRGYPTDTLADARDDLVRARDASDNRPDLVWMVDHVDELAANTRLQVEWENRTTSPDYS